MPRTLREALAAGCDRLHAAGVETPRLDAELLLAHALGRNRTYLLAHLPDPLPDLGAASFDAFLERRQAREPLPYILGEWEWMGMRLRVGPGVLIPRPETETLVEEAASRLAPNARVLDVGAGSGCISLGMARLLSDARVLALELSPEAVAVARENVARQVMEHRVKVREGRFPEAVAGEVPFDAVFSNPPYIPTGEVERLAPEVPLHQPRVALDGGPDGLDVLRPLALEHPQVPGARGALSR